MIPTRPHPALLLLLLLLLPSIALCGCSAGTASEQPQSATASTTGTAADAEPTSDNHLFIKVVEPLHDATVPGISLEEALARAGRQVPLLQSGEGTISKVVFIEAPDGSPNFDLAILYSTGVELHIRTIEHNLAGFATFVNAVKFRDGADHLVRATNHGREVVIVRGGVQSEPGDGHVVRPVASWNQSGLGYDVYLPDQDPNEVQRLTAIVSAVH